MQQTLEKADDRRFAVDTTFVLFFLAVDLGQSTRSLGVDTAVSMLAVMAVLILPYMLPSDSDRPEFTSWLLGRGLIATYATVLGIMFGQSLGVVLPETFSYLPMTLVIVTAVASCYLQLCAMIRFRLAR